MADLATLQGWLLEAQTARHQLLTGSLRARVMYNGQNEVWFVPTEISGLNTYIASLESQVAALSGDPRRIARPISLTF